jgi:hypothetical protein
MASFVERSWNLYVGSFEVWDARMASSAGIVMRLEERILGGILLGGGYSI